MSLINLKAGFHNIKFEESSSYQSKFICHLGKFRLLRMHFGLTQAPAHFQYVVKSILAKGALLPCTVYLDNIAIYGDNLQQVLADTAEAMPRLAAAGFMIKLEKSHLCETSLKVLGHLW